MLTSFSLNCLHPHSGRPSPLAHSTGHTSRREDAADVDADDAATPSPLPFDCRRQRRTPSSSTGGGPQAPPPKPEAASSAHNRSSSNNTAMEAAEHTPNIKDEKNKRKLKERKYRVQRSFRN